MIREEFDREEGGFNGVAKRMGLTEQNILSRAATIFQRHKLAFPKLLVREPFHIRGENKTGIELPLTLSVFVQAIFT
jgi:hypothetical protein